MEDNLSLISQLFKGDWKKKEKKKKKKRKKKEKKKIPMWMVRHLF